MAANALLPTVRFDMFFRPETILRAKDNATLRYLRRAGGATRKTARRSMRAGGKKGKVSRPGEAPRTHTKKLKDGILFGLERAKETVVIGPTRFNQISIYGGKPTSGTIPSVLEYGGTLGVIEVFKLAYDGRGATTRGEGGRFQKGAAKFRKKWVRADLRSKRRNSGLPTRVRRYTIKPRPYMGPALEKITPSLPKMWADSVR